MARMIDPRRFRSNVELKFGIVCLRKTRIILLDLTAVQFQFPPLPFPTIDLNPAADAIELSSAPDKGTYEDIDRTI